MEHEHEAIKCMIQDCDNEATRWISTEDIAPKDVVKNDTFYLCGEHAEEVSPNDETVPFLMVGTGRIELVELAVYSCDENCKVCNE